MLTNSAKLERQPGVGIVMIQIVRGLGSSLSLLVPAAIAAALIGCDQSPTAPSKPPAAAVSNVSAARNATPTTSAASASTQSTTRVASSLTTRASNADIAADINAPFQPASRPATAPSTKQSAARWTGEHFSVALPDGWKAYDGVPPRIGTLMTTGGLQVAVLIFNGDGGGTIGNVNLWRRQVGLTPVGEREMRETNKRIEGSEGAFTLVDLQGPSQRMLAAVLPQSDQTVFLKMTGPFAVVEREQTAFVEMAKSLRVEGR